MKILLTGFVVFALLIASPAVGALEDPPWQQPSDWPDRIIATLAASPATEFSVNWRTTADVERAKAQIVEARSQARFDLGARTIEADTERFSFDPASAGFRRKTETDPMKVDLVAYHSVTFSGLEPDTFYAYRLEGAEGNWSSWRHIRTAPERGAVEFLYFGDTQQGIRSHVSRLFETAGLVAPEARFMLHVGDLVNTGTNDRQWAEWFEAGGWLFGRVPSIPVPGNHDYQRVEETQLPALTPFWRPQFRLPVEKSLPEELNETVYDIRYTPDLHLFAIDSTGPYFDKQMEWLTAGFRASDAKWRIVYMHHPFFSWVGDGYEKEVQTKKRAQFDQFLADNKVDMVLTGHRHSYQRAESGAGVHHLDKSEPYEVDTVFLVTASTTNRGTTKQKGWELFSTERGGNISLTRWGDYVPLFGIIRVEGDKLEFRAVDALGQTYDAFSLERDDKGRKIMHNGAAAFGPTWDAESVGPYQQLERH